MPKSLAAAGSINSLVIVIIALSLFLIFFIILYVIIRDLLAKFGKNRILKLPISVFLISLVAIAWSLSYVGSTPTVCNSCHPMKRKAQELRLSVHNELDCIACHRETKLMAFPAQSLKQARMVFKYLRKDYPPSISTTVSNDVCTSCHNNLARDVSVRHKVKMSHNEVIEGDIKCTECHDDIAHSKKKNTSMMEKCSSCHNNEKVSARCEVCHLDKVWLEMRPNDWGINHGEGWLETHGAKSLYICKYCHEEKDCLRCHSTTVPHPEGWSYIHGDEAKVNRNDCRICHKAETVCLGCHGTDMPHPSGWLSMHKFEARKVDKDVCSYCHTVKDCDQCHKQHKSSVKKMGGTR